MFVLEMPYIPAGQTTMSVSQQASYGTIGICHFAENPSPPDNAANMLAVSAEVENYFAKRRWRLPGPVSATVLNVPQHGTLTLDHPGIYTYHPAPGYRGSDRITIAAKVGQKTLRIEYFVRVMEFLPIDDLTPDMYARGYCPRNSRVWKISMVPKGSGGESLLV